MFIDSYCTYNYGLNVFQQFQTHKFLELEKPAWFEVGSSEESVECIKLAVWNCELGTSLSGCQSGADMNVKKCITP